jgi:hypothetical protein
MDNSHRGFMPFNCPSESSKKQSVWPRDTSTTQPFQTDSWTNRQTHTHKDRQTDGQTSHFKLVSLSSSKNQNHKISRGEVFPRKPHPHMNNKDIYIAMPQTCLEPLYHPAGRGHDQPMHQSCIYSKERILYRQIPEI